MHKKRKMEIKEKTPLTLLQTWNLRWYWSRQTKINRKGGTFRKSERETKPKKERKKNKRNW